MNISKLGSQAGPFAQPAQTSKGVHGPATPAATPKLAGPAAPATPAASGPAAPHRHARVTHFAERVDKRLDALMHQRGLDERQVAALQQLKQLFDGHMMRLDGAIDGGDAQAAMHSILGSLHTSVQAILGVVAEEGPAPGDAVARGASAVRGRTAPGGDAPSLDRIA
jgi:hypothetical protein